MNNTGWLGDMEQRRQQEYQCQYGPYSVHQGQQPPHGPYSANSWTTPEPSAPLPSPISSVSKLPPTASDQSMPPPRQPALNPEAENHQDVLPSYDDVFTDGMNSPKY